MFSGLILHFCTKSGELCTMARLFRISLTHNEMTTAIIHHPIFEEHDTGFGHPESPSRYSVVMDALRGDDELWTKLREVQAQEATRGDIQAAHSPQLYKL